MPSASPSRSNSDRRLRPHRHDGAAASAEPRAEEGGVRKEVETRHSVERLLAVVVPRSSPTIASVVGELGRFDASAIHFRKGRLSLRKTPWTLPNG